ncbi:MAG: hypothetical protein R3F50_05290 [Gammaproteobacteria bacterium]
MMQKYEKLLLRVCATTVFLAATAMPAIGAEVSGSWAVTVMTDAGSGMMNFVLEQEGETIKGTVTGDAGNASVTGTVADEVVTFSHNLPDYGISAVYKGKLVGSTINGTVDYGNGAAMGSFSAELKE